LENSASLLREGRRRVLAPFWKILVTCITLALAAFEIYTAPFGTLDPLLQRAIFVSFVLGLTFIYFTFTAGAKSDKVPFYDLILALLSFTSGVYILLNGERIVTRWVGVDPMAPEDIFFTAILVLLVLEVTRRTVGPPLLGIIILFIAYTFIGALMPGEFGHRGMTLIGFLDRMVYTFDGILGTPIGVTCTYVYMFILFGQVFNEAGGGTFFFRLASAIAGRMVGGPAKMAVVASAFYGTMSGSPTSNVVTTGSFTIPLMKRLGYSSTFAGAVEAAASTGGSILPPIMGTAAFLMVDVAGIPYIDIAVAAAIPGLLYYLGVMLQVHFRAVKKGLRPVVTKAEEQEKPLQVLKENIHFLIPLAVLIWLLAERLNPTVVGLAATCVTIVVSWLKPGYRMGPKEIVRAFYNTGTGILTVANASAAAGMVIGGIMLTGLGGKFTSLVFQATGGSGLLCLTMVALVCILLGMGMPIPAAYVLTATLAAPALLELGFPLLASHLFIVYFSAMSALTPPVAVAAYAGAAISGANPNSTGFQATRLAMAAYLVPFVFMYRKALLLQGGFLEIIWATLIATLAVWSLAGGLEGYFYKPVSSRLLRALLIGGGTVLLWPEVWADLLGVGIVAGVFLSLVVAQRLRATGGPKH
jgi:TRAP transporter 4TM/12TM fusion protein